MANDGKAKTNEVGLGINEKEILITALKQKELELRDPAKISPIKNNLNWNEIFGTLINGFGMSEESDIPMKVMTLFRGKAPSLDGFTNEAMVLIKPFIDVKNIDMNSTKMQLAHIGKTYENWHKDVFEGQLKRAVNGDRLTLSDIFDWSISKGKVIPIEITSGLIAQSKRVRLKDIPEDRVSLIYNLMVA